MRASAVGDMGVGADDEAGAAVDIMAERLFLAGRLGVEIEDRDVATPPERRRGEFRVDARGRDRRARP